MSVRRSTVLPSRLLGRHVRRRAQDHAGQRRRGTCAAVGEFESKTLLAESAGKRLRQSEVQHLYLAFGRELHIGGFQVAVDDVLLVGVLQRLANLLGNVERFLYREGAVAANALLPGSRRWTISMTRK